MGELREKLKSFAMDNHYKKYGELNAKRLEEIADEYAIDFAEWSSKYKCLDKKGWFTGSYQLEMAQFKTTKELLEIYKKEKGL